MVVSVTEPLMLTKLHATGNDFLVQMALTEPSRALPPAVVAALCDRNRGVGADGLITIEPGTDGADCRMVLHNADGSRAEMTGNGSRCLAFEAHRVGIGNGKRLIVDTDGGRREIDIELDPVTGEVVHATVDMGPITFDPLEIPLDAPSPFDLEATIHGTTYRGDAAGIGNPHLVLFVDDPESTRVTQHGSRLENDGRFPNRTNVEFIALGPGDDELTMRVWERGVGETLSCGTGACAAAAVAHHRGLVGDRVIVHVLGGDLSIDLAATIRLGGPVEHVFDVILDGEQWTA
jgi:diaminopimelate epimerase